MLALLRRTSVPAKSNIGKLHMILVSGVIHRLMKRVYIGAQNVMRQEKKHIMMEPAHMNILMQTEIKLLMQGRKGKKHET